MRVLVDTNVYLEIFLKRERCDDAVEFFSMSFDRRNQIYISSISLRDIGYIVHRFVHDKEISRNFQMKAYCMSSKVAPISADAAIESLYSENPDYEDSLQSIAAQESMCDAIITFNKKDYRDTRMPVFTPKEICKIWKENPRIIIE